MRTPALAVALPFVALLTAVAVLRAATRSDASPDRPTPAPLREDLHPASPFERMPVW